MACTDCGQLKRTVQKLKDMCTEVEIERDNRIPEKLYNEQIDAYLELHDENLKLEEELRKLKNCKCTTKQKNYK